MNTTTPLGRTKLCALVASALAALLAGAITTASAAPQCGPRAKLVEALGQKYQENRQALGLAGPTALIELYVSEKGTWTLLKTSTSGLACVLAAGESWHSAPQQVAGVSL